MKKIYDYLFTQKLCWTKMVVLGIVVLANIYYMQAQVNVGKDPFILNKENNFSFICYKNIQIEYTIQL